MIWRRLSHPNVLPVLGISPKLFPLCIVSEWMIDGNIMDFITKHPEVNRLRLVRLTFVPPSIHKSSSVPQLAETASGLQYLHSMDIVHSDIKPVRVTQFWLTPADGHVRKTSSSIAISAHASQTMGSSQLFWIRPPWTLVVRLHPLSEPFGIWRRNC